ncbi:MAG: glycosyltransferase family 39 protein [Candidatus Aenigmatarchaeota archaeon]
MRDTFARTLRKATKAAKAFRKEHALLADIILIALIVRIVYLNAFGSQMFDEHYYVPAARSILANWTDTNPEHPPLVKLVLAGSMAAFGDNALAWRLPAVAAGLASIALFYFVALGLSRDKRIAVLSAALLALDPTHIVLSRVAMLDIFMLAFGLAGAHFALRNNWLWSGVFFGLAVASKWPAALILLAVLSFLCLRKRLDMKGALFSFVIMALVYVLAYAPFIALHGPEEWLSLQAGNAQLMSTMEMGSSRSSYAYQWLYLWKPVYFAWWPVPGYYAPEDMLWLVRLFGAFPDFAIIVLSNPLTWLGGMAALGWLAFNRAKKMSAVRMFSVLWFVCTYVPFLLMPRTRTALYYMLLIIPAYMLALSQLLVEKKWVRPFLVLFAASVLLLLPFAIGLPVPKPYMEFMRPFIGPLPID